MFLKLTGKNDILDENCELEFKDLKSTFFMLNFHK